MEKKEKDKTVQRTVKKPLHVIYVGDTILQLGLLKSTVYMNSLPKQIEEAFLKVPALKQLFVPVGEASQALIDAKTEGTKIYAINNVVKDVFKKGVK